ncbi:phage major capsid protein [Gilvimarinus agarilyticus]|uniref:phage major capsid protein n=1 Tax=Gilvimarinus agarilyticus TaxID=679259 RepID=UPI0005A11CDB|nr:phage major capsid protein [Gilvimarinus agarilyticus]
MAQSIQALREKRNGLAKEMRNHFDKFDGDNAPKWDAEAEETHNNLKAQVEEIDNSMKRHQDILDIEASEHMSNRREEQEPGKPANKRGTAQANEKDREIFQTYLRGGVNALTPDQQQYVAEQAAKVQNTMSTGTPAEGGYLVPEQFGDRLIESLKDFGGMRDVATIMSTESGATINYPTTDATSEEGELIAENTEVDDEDPSFGTVGLGAFMFSSKGVAVPFQLLQDTGIDLEAHLYGRLGMRIGRITNRMYTVGTGTGQPQGAVPASGAGKVGATGKATSVDFSDINALIHSVDPAYRRSGACSLMFHDNTLRDLKDIRDDQNRPLWLPGVGDDAPDTIYRYAYAINQDMPVMAADAKSMLFGDFSKFIIRDVRQMMLFRMTDSAYTRKAQVGFLAFLRSDSRLTDAGALKHYQNSST